jgi:hypothetical protein
VGYKVTIGKITIGGNLGIEAKDVFDVYRQGWFEGSFGLIRENKIVDEENVPR